jgi:hypothetical protein
MFLRKNGTSLQNYRMSHAQYEYQVMCPTAMLKVDLSVGRR